jgi:acyl-CoA reductase-like NAD-dependent aldehyde dehydrogenase
MPWATEEEVISRANNTLMGLGASVWTNDLEQGKRIAQRLEAGNVYVNAHGRPTPTLPFGGHKESGIGVEWGAAGLKGYCNSQTLIYHRKP